MTLSPNTAPEDPDLWVLYDGECIFCANYTRLVRLNQAVGEVAMIDARRDSPQRREAIAAGLDLGNGMVLKHAGKLYHGADCLHRLALLTTRSGAFNQITARLFASPWLARLLYPVLKAGRLATLTIRRRSPHIG